MPTFELLEMGSGFSEKWRTEILDGERECVKRLKINLKDRGCIKFGKPKKLKPSYTCMFFFFEVGREGGKTKE